MFSKILNLSSLFKDVFHSFKCIEKTIRNEKRRYLEFFFDNLSYKTNFIYIHAKQSKLKVFAQKKKYAIKSWNLFNVKTSKFS